MKKDQALQILLQGIPATGEVEFEKVAEPLRATKDGRAALDNFHAFRRSGAISARINRETGELMVSRPSGGS